MCVLVRLLLLVAINVVNADIDATGAHLSDKGISGIAAAQEVHRLPQHHGSVDLLLAQTGKGKSSTPKVVSSGAQELSPVTRLILVLFKTFAVLIVGACCKELGFIKPEAGHMQALGFFVGKIGFPLLVFRTVATANMGTIDMKVVLACTLAKILIMLATWGLSFAAYMPNRSKGQRVLTSSVFSFFVVASNDFAVGFPVIDALYGPSMIIYLSANALVAAMLFQPLTMVLFGLGKKMKEDDEEGGQSSSGSGVLKTLKEIALNPIIFATIVGLVINMCFHTFLVFDGEVYSLPHPISDVVDILTTPFITLALFVTGVSLKAPSVTNWVCLLTVMKVFVCAYLSYIFALVLGVSTDQLLDFSFFYGMIPTSSGPLIFAKEFDESAVDIVATSILLGLGVAGPNMMVTAMFLSEPGDLTAVFEAILTYSGIMSACAAFAFLVLMIVTIRMWTRAKMGIAMYSLVASCYTATLLWLIFSKDSCEAVRQGSAPVEVVFNTLQKACVLLVFYLEFSHARADFSQRVIFSILEPLALILLAIVPGFLTKPRTLSQICHIGTHSWSDNLTFTLVSGFFLLLGAAFALQDFVQTGAMKTKIKNLRRRFSTAQERRESEMSSSFTAPENYVDPRASNRRIQEDTTGAQIENAKASRDGEFTVWALFRIQGVRILLQFINSMSALFGQEIMGGFTQMLIIECIMEHAQMVFLVIAVLFDKTFKIKLVHAFSHFLQEMDFLHSHGHHVSHHY